MSGHINDRRLFLLSSVPTKADQTIKGAKLASYNDMLRSYIAFKEDLVVHWKNVALIEHEAAKYTVHCTQISYCGRVTIIFCYYVLSILKVQIDSEGGKEIKCKHTFIEWFHNLFASFKMRLFCMFLILFLKWKDSL